MHSCPGLETCPMLLVLLVYDFRAVIRHLHIPHNAPYLPPKILHNFCVSFLLGFTAVLREIENQGCAKFWGAKVDVQVAYEPFQINKTF